MNFKETFFHDLKFTTTLRKVFIISCIIGIYSILPLLDYFDFKYFNTTLLNTNLAYLETVFGIIIGLMLIFRANRSYERWWEARTLWGNLVGSSRNLAMKIKTVGNLEQAQFAITSEFIINFSLALKNKLKQNKINSAEGNTARNQNKTVQLVNNFYSQLKEWRLQNMLSIQELWLIDQELRNFMMVAGGCERIKSTLVSASFRVFSRQIIFIYILILPWIFADLLTYFVILLTIIASYLILGLEEIAHNLEDPFGDTGDHLDLTKITNTIETSIKEILCV